jgi:hypothetical protein
MDESAHPSKPSGESPTPETAALLKLLSVQAAARRQGRARGANPLQTNSFRYGSLVAIVIFAFGSLGLLEWFLSAMPKPVHATVAAGASPMAGGGKGSAAPATPKAAASPQGQ